MVKKSDALEMLRDALGDKNADFREDQWETIDDLVNNGKKVHVIQRTGWGKSSVYFAQGGC